MDSKTTDLLLFRPMELHEFTKYIKNNYLEKYIEDITIYEKEFTKQMGKSPREFSEQQFKDTLPDGMNTLNNFFWMAINKENGKKIGYFWFSVFPEKTLSLLSEINVFEDYRKMGYGGQILNFWEKYVIETHPEIDRLYLHVFKHNPDAKRFFERYGLMLFYQSFEGDNLLKMLNRERDEVN